MKLYLFFCISLNLAYRGFSQNVDIPNVERLSGSMENTSIPHTKKSSNSTDNFFTSNLESTLNSTEDLFISTRQSTLNSTENTTKMTTTQLACPENMIGVNENRICLCLDPFVLMSKNRCSTLFRQGPCEPGNYVVQSRKNYTVKIQLARCAPNPCFEDGLVPDNGTCRNITTNPLCNYGRLYYVEATLEIGCEYVYAYSVIKSPLRRLCPPDSRPDRNGICRRKL